jgi:hypothetical protein
VHLDRHGRRRHAGQRAAANDGKGDGGLGSMIERITMREATLVRIHPDG